MFDYIIKRFKKIVIRILLLMFFLLSLLLIFLYLNYRLDNQYPNPNDVYAYVENNKGRIYLNEKNREFLGEKNIWSIRIDKNGEVIESFNKPEEVSDKFDLVDVAKFAKFYLADYPVFTYIVEDGLLIFAYPKNSLDKLPVNYYSYKNLVFNLQLVLIFISLFLLFVYIIYRIDIKEIFKNMLPFQKAIDSIYEDDYEKIDEHGELKDLAISINMANERYINLKISQDKWIRGVSHDVRTPLAKISWEINKDKIDRKNIQEQVLKISNILEGLNLTTSLSNIDKESFSEENPLKLIRKLIVDKLNENPEREIVFENNIKKLNKKIKMEPNLFYRMLENILKNSLKYTEGKISFIISNPKDNKLKITILDEGEGVDENIIKKIYEEDLTNITKHGLGIFISKQIAELHDGTFIIRNNYPGLKVSFIFSLDENEYN